MNLTRLPLSKIRPYWRNPRKNEKAVDAVVKSIQEYGYNSPIIVDKDFVIIAGHTRHKALTKLGWAEVDVQVLDIDPEKAKAYRIADNKTSELAEWDYKNLIPELREITDLSAMDLFFPELDLSEFVKEEAGTANFQEVTAGAVQKAQDAQDNRFDNTGGGDQEKISIICPHCLETVFINKKDLAK